MIDILMIGVGLVLVLSVVYTLLKKNKRAVYASRRHTFQKNRRASVATGSYRKHESKPGPSIDNSYQKDFEELDILGLKTVPNSSPLSHLNVNKRQTTDTLNQPKSENIVNNKLPDQFESERDSTTSTCTGVDTKVKKDVTIKQTKCDPSVDVPDFIACHVIADTNQPFQGHDLLQSIVSTGLCYGDMEIFHYDTHDQFKKKQHLFSCAQITNPGTFDIQNMGSCQSQGLSLFFSVRQSFNPVLAYEELIKTANQLKLSLGGQLYNEKMEPLTQAVIDQHRLSMASALSLHIKQQCINIDQTIEV